VQWLPLAFLLLWRAVDRPGWRRATLAAAALVVVAAASAYLGLIALTVAPVAVVAAVFSAPDQRGRRLLVVLSASVAAGAVVLVFVWSTMPDVLTQPGSLAFPTHALDLHTASAWRYLAPPDGHPLFDPAAASGVRGPGAVEQQLSLGWSVLVLAAIGCGPITRIARRAEAAPPDDRRSDRFRLAVTLTAVIAFLCSLPPMLTMGAVELPMPSQALHHVAPIFRAFARFGVLVALMVTVLAGAGVAALIAHRSRAARALATALLAVAVIEYLPPRPLSRDVLPTPAHRRVAAITGARVLDCTMPSPGALAGLRLLMRAEVIAARGVLEDCAEPEFGTKLAAFGFTHAIVRRDGTGAAPLEGGPGPAGTARVSGDALAALFAVTAPRPDVYIVRLEGFSPREFRGTDSWRWMGASAALVVANLTSHDAETTFALELDPFAGGRTIVARSASSSTGAVPVDRAGWVHVGPLVLPAGESTVSLTADRTLTPASVGAGGDPRPLSVRLRSWRVLRGPSLSRE
jgi:hypothetical protein